MKKLIATALLCSAVSLCGCSSNQKTGSESGIDSNIIVVSDTSLAPTGDERIKYNASPEVSAPDGSISIEEAYKLLDSCGMEDLYLTESMSAYSKYYFNTVDYHGEKYYSFYPFITAEGKRLLVGTNVLVSCSGTVVLAKNWMGGYDTVTPASAQNDKPYTERYTDAAISPNEALAALAKNEKELGLKYDISEYVFEFDDRTADVNGKPCYRITPKLEYLDHIELLKPLYVSADKDAAIVKNDKG